MDTTRHLIVGAGMTGLATAAHLEDKDYLVLEGDSEIGGYCKTIRKEGFVWDYSGHFFHFKHPEIEAWLRSRMTKQKIRVVDKKSFIAFGGTWIDFPFQKNIHQLPQGEFIECLHDLYFADAARAAQGRSAEEPASFKEMLYARFGRGIAEKFLIPYNEKLYACDLGTLDKDAMGRFFPHANVSEIIANMRDSNNASYNARFTYPEGGAIEYVRAVASYVPEAQVALGEALVGIDVRKRIAKTTKREIRYERLVSSAPLNRLLALTGIAHAEDVFSWNKVLVFNLGFDRKGPRDVHWVYYPSRERSFYRIGFYDNIFDTDRMSLYVELGYAPGAAVDVEAARARVLADLAAEGVIDGHQLVAHHSVVMDPAYVHITRASMEEKARVSRILAANGIYSIGRYGGWTYCSIEDNIVEARALAADLNAA